MRRAEHPFADQLAWQFRESRLTRGISQADAARAAGMNQQSLCRYESGRQTNIRIETLVRLCGAIGIAPSDIMAYAASGLVARKKVTK